MTTGKTDLSVSEILKAALQQDISLLTSRGRLETLLDKQVPASLTRDALSVKTALRSDVGGIYFSSLDVNEEGREQVQQQVREILTAAGMQDRRIQFVLDTFAHALEWDVAGPVPGPEPETRPETELPPEPSDLSASESVSAGQSGWRCACGQENDGKFCVGCGQPRPDGVSVPTGRPVVPPSPAAPSIQPVVQPHPAAAASHNGTPPVTIALLVVVIGLLCFGVGYLLKDSLFASKTPPSAPASSSSSTSAANTTKASAPADDKKVLAVYISDKEQYDHEISVLAQDINGYLGQHSDFRNASGLQSRAQLLCQKIKDAQSGLQSENVANTALKSKLNEVFAQELQRVLGLSDGMADSRRGQGYQAGFQRGTAAAYRYDDVNAEFNRMLQATP